MGADDCTLVPLGCIADWLHTSQASKQKGMGYFALYSNLDETREAVSVDQRHGYTFLFA